MSRIKSIDKVTTRLKEIVSTYQIDNLYNDGAIYYMNANDGTKFDNECNGRTCEFMIFYNDGYGAIRAFVTHNNEMHIFIYDQNEMSPKETIVEKVNFNYDTFVNYLFKRFDMNELWDSVVE